MRTSANVLARIALVHHIQGRIAPARQLYDTAVSRLAEAGEDTARAYALRGLGMLHKDLGDRDQARGCLHAALSIFQHAADPYGLASVLHRLAKVLAGLARLLPRHLGRRVRAARDAAAPASRSAPPPLHLPEPAGASIGHRRDSRPGVAAGQGEFDRAATAASCRLSRSRRRWRVARCASCCLSLWGTGTGRCRRTSTRG